MSDIRTDDEQLEALKSWWKENGTQILTTVVVVAAGYFGWTYWSDARQAQIHAANAVYMQMVETAGRAEIAGVALDEELQTIRFLADQLQADYANTQYAVLGALVAARTAVREGDLDEAHARLQWARDNADAPAEAQLIDYRLARVLVAQENYAGALDLLQGETDEFAALYADLRGDILLQQGDSAGALAAYQAARGSLLESQQHYLPTLQLKIDNLTSGLGSL